MFNLLTALFSFSKIDTVPELDVKHYLGRWYQVYGAPTNVVFQGYGECITADYGLMDNGQVSILNSQINRKGELETIGGYAYVKNETEPGQLTINLDGVPVESSYWVVGLGPVENDEYQFSIVTAPSGISMWALVRDLENYDDEAIVKYLDEYKFKYVSIKQDDCKYNDE
tara:strand:- start:592 stop:1101 length:510 start_codon:yes stop_codon:yes gene_type:complete